MSNNAPDIDTSLLRLYKETAETVQFYCFTVPKIGVTIKESKTLQKMHATAPDDPTLASLAESLGTDAATLATTLLGHGCEVYIPPENSRRFDAQLAWVAWCLNNRGVTYEGHPVTRELLETVVDYGAVGEFQRLLTPGAAGGGKGK